MSTPIIQYCNLMEQVKERLAVVNTIVGGYSPMKRDDFDGEIVCLHLRKILELIAFASLCAHKEAYSQARSNFEKDWNAKRLLKTLRKLHPEFYPRPVKLAAPRMDGIKHFDDINDEYLTLEDFEFLYDTCGDALHIWNPFRLGPRIVNFNRPISEWTARVASLLSTHWIRLMGTKDVWLIQMNRPDDGKVHAYLGNAVESDLKHS